MGGLSALPNIGRIMEEQLWEAGITTPEQLRETGSRETWLRIRAFDPSACLSRLCGLEGTIRGVRWHCLPDDIKRELKEFYNKHK